MALLTTGSFFVCFIFAIRLSVADLRAIYAKRLAIGRSPGAHELVQRASGGSAGFLVRSILAVLVTVANVGSRYTE